jgi:hypothetical protein
MDAPDQFDSWRWFDDPSVQMVTIVVDEIGLKDFPHSAYWPRRMGMGS